MFSFNPFDYDYVRPKQNFGLFEDDSYPFSSGYYAREQPTLFRSSSFRQPRYYQPSFYQPVNKPSYQSKHQSSDEEDEYDPFLQLFGLRTSKRDQNKETNDDLKQNSVKRQKDSNQSQQKDLKNDKPKEVKSGFSSPNKQTKELDSQRFDTDGDIEFKFSNYKCENPSAINVSVTKDGYIVLKTDDGYYWKNRIPDNCDLEKASCSCVKKTLSLKLPKKVVDQMEVDNSSVKKVVDQMEVDNSLANSKQQSTVKEEIMNDETIKTDDQTKVNKPVVINTNAIETKDLNDVEDPDAPIVEDIIEDY